MRRRTMVTFGVALLLVATGACGSDESSDPTGQSGSDDTTVTSAEVAPTSDSSSSPASSNPASSSPATTVATPAAEAAWVSIVPPDFAYSDGTFDSYGSFFGAPASPPFPAAGEPLADGVYPAVHPAEWSPDRPDALDVSVYRLESCATPGMTEVSASCESGYESGVDPAVTFPLTLPLDATIRVVVSGSDCRDAQTGRVQVIEGSDGVGLRNLLAAFASDYEAGVAPLLPTATDPFALTEQIAAAPPAGFSASNDESCGSALTFVAGDAPPVLLQQIAFSADDASSGLQPVTPTDAVALSTVVVENGSTTLYLYAGFQS